MRKALFSSREVEFLHSNEVCRVATAKNNIPHVVPVSYLYENNCLIFGTGFDKKYQDILENNRIALAIDMYHNSIDNRAIIINGSATLIEKNPLFGQLYKKFFSRFDWYRLNPWSEGEGAFVKVEPISKHSWGFEEKAI